MAKVKISNIALSLLDTTCGLYNDSDITSVHIYNNEYGTFKVMVGSKIITVSVDIKDAEDEEEK